MSNSVAEKRARRWWEQAQFYKRCVDKRVGHQLEEVVECRWVEPEHNLKPKHADDEGYWVKENQYHVYDSGVVGITGGSWVAGPFLSLREAVARRMEMDENSPPRLDWYENHIRFDGNMVDEETAESLGVDMAQYHEKVKRGQG